MAKKSAPALAKATKKTQAAAVKAETKKATKKVRHADCPKPAEGLQARTEHKNDLFVRQRPSHFLHTNI